MAIVEETRRFVANLLGAGRGTPPAREDARVEPAGDLALSAVQQGLLDDLRARGIATVAFDELFGDAALWSALRDDMQTFESHARRTVPAVADRAPEHKYDYLVRRWHHRVAVDAERPRFPSDGHWLRFAASEILLAIIEAYRGVRPKLASLDCWYTVPSAVDHAPVASQRWHRDMDEPHVVKCFLYFSDVDAGSGPFEYIPDSAPGGRRGDVWPWTEGRKGYPPAGDVEAHVPQSERLTMTGPRGTVVLCDTSGLHRGGFARTAPRLISVATYVSSRAIAGRAIDVEWREGVQVPDRVRYALT